MCSLLFKEPTEPELSTCTGILFILLFTYTLHMFSLHFLEPTYTVLMFSLLFSEPTYTVLMFSLLLKEPI